VLSSALTRMACTCSPVLDTLSCIFGPTDLFFRVFKHFQLGGFVIIIIPDAKRLLFGLTSTFYSCLKMSMSPAVGAAVFLHYQVTFNYTLDSLS